VPNFNYHGRNTYAYLLDRYGYYTPSTATTGTGATGASGATGATGTTTAATGPGTLPLDSQQKTFDFVTIQLYEGYSHAEYNTTQLRRPVAEYIAHFARSVQAGWEVDYSADAELRYPYVHRLVIEKSQLVVGLANGWAGDGKFFLAYPDQVILTCSVFLCYLNSLYF
jgi:hypothetical protein